MSSQVKLLHHDDQVLVVHKPAGWTVYKEDGVPKDCYLQPYCEDLFAQKLYPVHRLDRGTCGIVIFSESPRWARVLQEQFQRKNIEKRYLAVVAGELKGKRMVNVALSEKGKNEVSAQTEMLAKKSAIIKDQAFTLLELKPTTGRYHQIRKHCKAISHPIIGDKQYGNEHVSSLFEKETGSRRMLLSSVFIKFQHPRTEKIVHFSDTPDQDFEEIMQKYFTTKPKK